MKTERILELADMLDAHAEAVAKMESPRLEMGFNMTTWGDKGYDVYGHTCGTAACIAGWAAAAFGYTGRAKIFNPLRAEGLGLYAHDGQGGVLEIMGRVLGLTGDQAGQLFTPNDYWDEGEDDAALACPAFASITPSEAAVTLRKLAETGEVDWSHVKERHDAEWGAA